MAIVKLAKDGYGQLELNFAAFRRNGAIEAQCKMADGVDYLENGMLLAVDRAKREVGFPTGAEGEIIALNYTTEHMYDERHKALKDFRLEKNSFLPRLGYIGVADKFTTNTVCYDEDDFTTETSTGIDAILAAAKYGVPHTDGYIKLVKTKPADGFYLQVLEATTMPDGQKAVKFGGVQ